MVVRNILMRAVQALNNMPQDSVSAYAAEYIERAIAEAIANTSGN